MRFKINEAVSGHGKRYYVYKEYLLSSGIEGGWTFILGFPTESAAREYIANQIVAVERTIAIIGDDGETPCPSK
jgi:hypothetical protein